MTWPLVSLGEICRPRQHKTIPAKELHESGYPVYGANGRIGYYSEYTHDQTTIAITCRGATCGTINVVPPMSYVTGNAMALDNLNTKKADLNYLAHVLRYQGFESVITGAAQPQITGAPLMKYTIPLPPLDEQRRIAGILDQADALRRLRARALDKLGSLGQAIFHKMFGSFETGFENWPTIELGSVIVDAKIGLVRGASEQGGDLPVPYLRMDSIGLDGSLLFEGLRRVNASPREILDFSLRVGDFVLNTRNSKELVGKTAIVREPFEGVFNNNILRLRFNERLNSSFLDSFLRTISGKNALENQKSGTTSVFAIYQKSLMRMTVPLPPADLQKSFCEGLMRIHRETSLQRRALQETESLFTSLQHRAFRGEL